VITVPNTFIATTEAISQTVHGRCSWMSIRKPVTWIPKRSKRKLPPGPKPSSRSIFTASRRTWTRSQSIADRHGLAVVEDACQAHGALYKDKKAGSMGLAGCFSFYPGKNLGAFGEGGAVVTQEERTAETIRMIRDHGQNKKYYHDVEGYNGRLDAIQAGVLRIKLKRLAAWNESRRKNAAYYNERLSDIPGIQLPVEADYARSVYHLYVIHTDRRDAMQQFLADKGIATGLHYPKPLHLQNAYAHLGLAEGAFPAAENSARHLLSLPMFAELTRDQMDYVADSIKEFQST
jgi:dTDP-4-amino-4,6-dideoxygalactose transaminase